MENKLRGYDDRDEFIYNDNMKEIKEIIDGKIYYMAGGTFLHEDVITNIGIEFNIYFRNKNKKCKAYTEGLKVFLDTKRGEDYVLPDIAIICDGSKIAKDGYRGNPELIVEVMSDSTRKVDRMAKLNLYERSGVKEYWIVEPELKSIEQYILADGRYVLREVLVLLNENKFNDLNDEQKSSYTAIIKPTMFDELEIDLNEIF